MVWVFCSSALPLPFVFFSCSVWQEAWLATLFPDSDEAHLSRITSNHLPLHKPSLDFTTLPDNSVLFVSLCSFLPATLILLTCEPPALTWESPTSQAASYTVASLPPATTTWVFPFSVVRFKLFIFYRFEQLNSLKLPFCLRSPATVGPNSSLST